MLFRGIHTSFTNDATMYWLELCQHYAMTFHKMQLFAFISQQDMRTCTALATAWVHTYAVTPDKEPTTGVHSVALQVTIIT